MFLFVSLVKVNPIIVSYTVSLVEAVFSKDVKHRQNILSENVGTYYSYFLLNVNTKDKYVSCYYTLHMALFHYIMEK